MSKLRCRCGGAGSRYIHNQDELGICGKAFLILDRAPQIVSLADELVEYRAREYDSHANVLATGAVQALHKVDWIEGVVHTYCSLRVRGEQEAAEGGLSVFAQTLVTTNISSSPQRSHSRPHSRLSSCPGRQCARYIDVGVRQV